MDPMTVYQKAKRPVKEINANDIDKVFRFKILLPNGTSIGLALRDSKPEMPLEDFIGLVKDEYELARRQSESMKQKRPIYWKVGQLYLKDANDNEIRNRIKLWNFKPHKCHILWLYDGYGENVDTFENMWDLTPDTDLLMELPEEYTIETALADLIDNSLQAVWSNSKNDRRLISVDIAEDRISIFDSGPGMDGSDENSIVKWGKMGASIHRTSKAQAIGGKPPYLMPYFGMFGYGGPIASMHLGRHALVSSKTKESKKVYTLHLEREALLSSSDSENTWRTDGGIRDPSEDEIRKSPHGSLTKVEILEPKIKGLDIFQLQCKLKDIYFPYIQCDEMSNTGKTSTPIEFQVNGVNLAEIEDGEVAITNLHSCNGTEFVLQLHFSLKHYNAAAKSPGSKASREANARLKCVYFPILKGKESIERILEKLEAEGCGIAENYESFSRVSIRRLGRLLPDARWAWLPFMELRQKKGDKAHLLKRCCLRVKCFIDTDAGFNPTPSKTDLAHHNPFTIALKNFGNKPLETQKDISVEIYSAGKLLTPLQLEREYQDWLLHMHDFYDEEIDSGEDQPILVVSPQNKKALGISSDVVRVHKILKRKGVSWKCGQKIIVLKGACAGFHKNNVYATLEYFLIEGFQGDSGGEARIICRPLSVPDGKGCILAVNNGNASLDIRSSLSLPISVIDSGKCQAIESIEWDNQLEKRRQKAPSTIDLLSAQHCQELEVDGALPDHGTVDAGQVPPTEIVAVIRPASFFSSTASMKLDKKYIVNSKLEMSMEVKFRGKAEDCQGVQHIYSGRIPPSSRNGFHGLYIFPLGCKFPHLFRNAGDYTFSFFLTESSCKNCEIRVLVKASSKVGKWELLSNEKSRPYSVRVGLCFPPFSIACYDIYDNRIPFTYIPKVMVKVTTNKGVLIHANKMKAGLSYNKLTLKVKDVVIESNELDKIRPSYEATLVICPKDELVSVSIPCQVTPGSLQHVKAQPPILENQLLPGFVINHLILEMFDAYGNHVTKGSEVQLNTDGFHIQEQLGSKCKVDDHGCIDLGGLLKVTAGYGKHVSISVLSDNKVVFKLEFQTEKRELRVASRVPEFCTAGSLMKNTVFEIVNSKGDVDKTIHDDEKCGQSHTLVIKSESLNTDNSIRYAFRNGCCTVPAIPIPRNEGTFCFVAAHSCYNELHLSVKVPVTRAPKVESYETQSPCSDGKVLHLQDSPSLNRVGNLMLSFMNNEKVPVTRAPKVESEEIQSPCSDGKVLLLQDSPSLNHVGNLMVSIVNNEKGLKDEICRYGLRVGKHERALEILNVQKEEIEQVMFGLQASLEPHLLNNQDYWSTKEELMKHIEIRALSAASVFCSLSREFPFQELQTHFMEDVVGLVALLGTVCTNKLSRILAEYLGEDQMLAVVCRSFAAADALEKYGQSGEVDCKLALHEKAAALGKSINGRFLVICLEDIRPYIGDFEGSDPQRKLALPNPSLPNGNIPPGFMGYAVNMVNLDVHHLQTRTAAGHGLRETVFYRLLGELQIYDNREHMKEARAYINHGAVSLDGGILRENGIISLGYWNPEICFPVVASEKMLITAQNMEILKQIEEKKSELRSIMPLIGSVSKAHEKVLKKFNKKKEKYHKFMDRVEPMLKDHLANGGNSSEISPR